MYIIWRQESNKNIVEIRRERDRETERRVPVSREEARIRGNDLWSLKSRVEAADPPVKLSLPFCQYSTSHKNEPSIDIHEFTKDGYTCREG